MLFTVPSTTNNQFIAVLSDIGNDYPLHYSEANNFHGFSYTTMGSILGARVILNKNRH